MLILRFAAWILPVGVMILGAGVVSGQDYPNKPIRIFTSPAGGGTDFTARIIAQALSSSSLGQPVIIENRALPILRETVVKAAPDGYTLMVHTDYLYFELLLRATSAFPYDPERDFSPITMVSTEPLLLVVHPSLPVKSVRELISLAKARPGELNYASNGMGSVTHLAAALFTTMAGVNIVHIPYKGSGPALNDLIAGQVQVRFAGAGGVMSHIKSGRLGMLAVTSVQPSALFPGLPTVAATVPGYAMVTMVGVFAPAKTPVTIINLLNREIVRVLNQADVKEKLLNAGSEVVAGSPEQLSAYLKSEVAKWGKAIKDAGIKAE